MEINNKRIHLLHDRVLVRRQQSVHKTVSGILIPDAASKKPDRGEVVAVGAGEILKDGKVRPLDVKVGGEELLVMRLSIAQPTITPMRKSLCAGQTN
jgi:co-chaperonin GroES (HSP10)